LTIKLAFGKYRSEIIPTLSATVVNSNWWHWILRLCQKGWLHRYRLSIWT